MPGTRLAPSSPTTMSRRTTTSSRVSTSTTTSRPSTSSAPTTRARSCSPCSSSDKAWTRCARRFPCSSSEMRSTSSMPAPIRAALTTTRKPSTTRSFDGSIVLPNHLGFSSSATWIPTIHTSSTRTPGQAMPEPVTSGPMQRKRRAFASSMTARSRTGMLTLADWSRI